MMDWLPSPADFRESLRAALECNDGSRRHGQLIALAQHRLGFLETLQLDRAFGQSSGTPSTELVPVRLAMLSSSTAEHLAPAIRVAGLRRRLAIDIQVGPYGQHRQPLLDPDSALHRFEPQCVLFSLTASAVIGEVPLAATGADVEAFVGRAIDELRGLWQKARESLGASVIQQSFLNVADPLFGSQDRLVPGAPVQVIAVLNRRLGEAAAAEGVQLLDVARASERDGLDRWFDVACWLQAKLEIAHQAAPEYGERVARILAAQRGLSRKCLVLDLDNTLWGGVLGDDGLEGIALGEGSAEGEAHLAFQRYVKQLGERGVILAVCSKNDAGTAEAVFRGHPEMRLVRSDFAAFIANWDDKAINLPRIAAQLNIGLDSLVFVDDNPAERARIRESLPEVAVPELPADPAYYVRCLADAGYFEAVAFTTEDRQRNEQYAANALREAERKSYQSLAEFLQRLDMAVQFGPFASVDLARVAQLINKTNQFNPTTRRRSLDEVAAIAADERCLTLQFRLVDRFGDNGLVSAMILRPAEAGILDIDTWVMSCRVFGRELEVEAMNIAVETARRHGVGEFRADYIPTPKNNVVSELYPGLGFQRASGAAVADGATRWRLPLADYAPRTTPIARRAE